MGLSFVSQTDFFGKVSMLMLQGSFTGLLMCVSCYLVLEVDVEFDALT